MTRREKVLLQICIAIGVIGLCVIYLLRPAIREKERYQEELEALQFEELRIMTVLEAPGVETALAEQQKLAEENYEYFYGKLNTYTIDGILNHLTEECGLSVESMNIGDYIKVNEAALHRTKENGQQEGMQQDGMYPQEGQDAGLLLGCNVGLTVTGSYEQVLAFVEALSEESECIEVVSLDMYLNERNTTEEQAIEASLGLLMYGISDTLQEGEDW